MKTATFGLFLGFCIAGSVLGQPSATPLTFEVASVKPSAPDAPGMFIRFLPGGGLRITGASLKNLISLAYSVRAFQISNGPAWVDTERFDIEARAATSDAADSSKMGEEQRKTNERLKSLLTDRFQLTLHLETKEQPLYELIVANGGPKLQESTDDRGLIRKIGRGTLKGQAVGIGMLALNLSNELGRRVIDKTGLNGRYNFEVQWTPTQPLAAPLGPPPPGAELLPPSDSNGPSIFTALPEQLGLRLEPEKGAVEILVLDHAEKPSGN